MSQRDGLPDVGDGGAAATLAGLIVVALLVVGAFYVYGLMGGTSGATFEVHQVPAQARTLIQAG